MISSRFVGAVRPVIARSVCRTPSSRPARLIPQRWISSSLPLSAASKGVPDHASEDTSTRAGVPEDTASKQTLASRRTPDLFSLAGQTVIITGGGRGLGLTIAKAVLESGGHVAAVDLLPEPSQEEWAAAQETANSRGLSLSYTNLDVTDQPQVSSVVQKLFKAAPSDAPVRGLFMAAGIQMLKPALDYTPEQIRKIFDVNLTGSFLCAQAFAKEFINRNPGPNAQTTPSSAQQPASGQPGVEPSTGLAGDGGASIVFTGSMSAHVANFGLECAAYNASKAGVNQLARNFAMEWGKKGIRVNSLSPGYIRTAMTKALLDEKPELNEVWLHNALLGRLSTQDEYRGPVIFLLSNASSFVHGADLLVDGGHTAT